MTNPAYEATNSDVEKSCKFCGGSGYFQIQKTYNKSPCPCQFCTEFFTPHHNCMMQLSNELAEMKPVKLPSRFFHVTVAETISVLRESQVIEAITEAGGQVHSTCPRCKRTLNLTHKPNGEHYCHVVEGSE